MSIIDYRDCNDIDVQFEDGIIVASNECKKGRIKKSNFSSHSRVGEVNTANNGQKMTIISYRRYKDIDIQFEDGTIVVNKTYGSFKNGEIKNPNYISYNYRLGELSTNNDGQKMTIIAYRRYSDIDIQFEDGTIVTSRGYGNFKNGEIKNPNFNPYNRVGEINISNNGQKMIIASYRDAKDIDIQFEDGTIVTNKSYSMFKRGEIKNPNYISYNSRLGELSTNNDGHKMTIIDYRGSHDIDIQFEDGTIVINKYYVDFKKGMIKNPNYTPYASRLGEVSINNDGQRMTIIVYRYYNDIDVQFEDGTIVTSKTYSNFKSGGIKNPNFYNTFLGETNIANNGQKMTIISYRRCDDIDIQFEDGTIITNRGYKNFKRGSVLHPAINSKYRGILRNHTLLGLAYRLSNNSVYYYCECTKCGKKDILSPQQILNHKCKG